MTNREKFKEVFGKEIDEMEIEECIFTSESCAKCELIDYDLPSRVCCREWWQSEYKENKKAERLTR